MKRKCSLRRVKPINTVKLKISKELYTHTLPKPLVLAILLKQEAAALASSRGRSASESSSLQSPRIAFKQMGKNISNAQYAKLQPLQLDINKEEIPITKRVF